MFKGPQGMSLAGNAVAASAAVAAAYAAAAVNQAPCTQIWHLFSDSRNPQIRAPKKMIEPPSQGKELYTLI